MPLEGIVKEKDIGNSMLKSQTPPLGKVYDPSSEITVMVIETVGLGGPSGAEDYHIKDPNPGDTTRDSYYILGN